MARIDLKGLAHSYLPNPAGEDDYALRRMEHTWDDGGAYALLGPSGCGKTTLLNIISGLLTPSEGQVMFNGQDMTQLPPQDRNIAQVFQFPVIYDTMTVYDNLAFPLRNRHMPEDKVDARVREIAAHLDLTDSLKSRARGLTADAKQTISLGRGLVRSDVNAILFDEPLTVIDPHMKWHLRSKLKLLHRQLNHTMVYVTHDQTEALTFADKVVVMYGGQIVQLGTPQELFERPSHTFVGYFIGSPGMNVMPIELDGAAAVLGEHRIDLPGSADVTDTDRMELGVRPEYIRLGREGMPVTVCKVEDIGRQKIVRAELAGRGISIVIGEDETVPADARIRFDPKGINIYANDWRVEVGA